MAGYVFDIETNAVDFDDLPGTMKVIHCIVLQDIDTGEVFRYNNKKSCNRVYFGLQRLEAADVIAGHNILGFDIPAIRVLYPNFNPTGKILDTRLMSELMYTDMRDKDFSYTIIKNKNFPKHLIGRHSLESWGHRLGDYKDDFSKRMQKLGLDPWGDLPPEYEQEREDYCAQDVAVNVKLLNFLSSRGFSDDCIELEQSVRHIIRRQEKYGFEFDVQGAHKLHSVLVKEKLELTEKLKEYFKPFFVRNGKPQSFKKDMKRWVKCSAGAQFRKKPRKEQGYYEEVSGSDDGEETYQKIKLVEFNPGSRDHIAMGLQRIYGWKPKAFGADGKPSVDEKILKALNYPPAELLRRYFLIDKRLGMLAEGKEAWLRWEKNGRIYGRVNTLGAVTSRMTHSKPNVAQVPSNRSPFGKECRALFKVKKGKKLVGADADALELRCLAGYMAKWDNGEYIEVVLNGTKEEGTDIHTRNMIAVGLNSRDNAKTWFYAFIYGAGDYKLGTIIAADMVGKKVTGKNKLIKLGKISRKNFETNLPALGKLVNAVKSAAQKRKRIKGLDGRYHPVRSDHAALNTLLQGAGAILMKRALVITDRKLQDMGLLNSETAPSSDQINYEFVANIHDELQVEADEDIAELVGRTLEEALEEAGRYYAFACPITGGSEIGDNWSQTH